MISQHHPFRRQGTAFRPRLERLERRDCPSCTVFQNGQTLVILGDREANHIAIADTREGDITVTCDRGDAQRFAGVEQIILKTFAGDDEVTATFSNPPEPVFHFRADLGAGDDRLQINWFDPQPDPPSRAVRFDLAAGAGDDSVEFNMADVTINGQFILNTDSGEGNDNWMMNLGDLMINGEFVMSTNGGAGNDDLAIRAILPCLNTEAHVRFGLHGDGGDDRLAVLVDGAGEERSAQILGTMRLDLGGGAGDDTAILDIVTLDIRGAVLVNIDGNRGADRALLGVAADVRVFGLLDVNALGGAGNDVIESFIVPCILPAGRGNFTFDGGAGDDRISARIELDANSRGALAARVLGGLGNDDLTLAVYGVDDPGLLTALVDGGRGYDIARVTRNVRVRNCEEVFFLDEPR
jgi:hypothetical protein